MSFKMEKEKTNTTPYIFIDEAKNYMQIQGKWYLGGAFIFFQQITDWLEKYLITDFGCFTIDCQLEYFNSSATKVIYNLIRFLDQHSNDKNRIIINWICAEDDEMMIECGEDYQEDVKNLQFNIITK